MWDSSNSTSSTRESLWQTHSPSRIRHVLSMISSCPKKRLPATKRSLKRTAYVTAHTEATTDTIDKPLNIVSFGVYYYLCSRRVFCICVSECEQCRQQDFPTSDFLPSVLPATDRWLSLTTTVQYCIGPTSYGPMVIAHHHCAVLHRSKGKSGKYYEQNIFSVETLLILFIYIKVHFGYSFPQ